ncbi:MAG TPA: glycosyltransferase family 2 protein [Xanthobacteraceae bacterium]|nr:glycosyltransferase family 2 protein [Xanthobacteraceae bacterium]
MRGASGEIPAPSVCLCVPTYRRPDGLRRLLADVARLDYAGPLKIIVVDNDAEGRAGSDVVAALSASFRYPLICELESRRGHTYAYNRAFASACRTTPSVDYVAVLDDDEYPAPDWLTQMVAAATKFGADIVGGPVLPVFDDPDHWLADSGVFAPTRYATGPVPMIYGAGNMLIRRDVLEHYLDEPFRHDFAFTGGSDEEFFWRCRRDGRRSAWADEALVFETVPRSRTNVGYVLRRKFRIGTGATRIERRLGRTAAGMLRGWCKGFGLLGIGILSLPIAACAGRPAIMHSLMRTARGAGRIAAEFGILYEEYR